MLKNVLAMISDCLSDIEAGCAALFEEYASIGINILNKHFQLLTVDDKDDVIQNTFLKLVKGGFKNFQGTTSYEFLLYFKRIVTNEALTYIEYLKKDKYLISIDHERDCGEDKLPPIEIIDSKPTPDSDLQMKQLEQLIHTVLKDSPIETKQIFLMKVQEYKDKEISDILGIPMGTVASRYSRIRDKLRQLLDKAAVEEKP